MPVDTPMGLPNPKPYMVFVKINNLPLPNDVNALSIYACDP